MVGTASDVTSERDDSAYRRHLSVPMFVRGPWHSIPGRFGLLLVVCVLGLAFFGPFFGPYASTTIVDIPFAGSTAHHVLGTDELGRDVLSRYLQGGITLVIVSFLATFVSYVVGVTLGLVAGFTRRGLDFMVVGIGDLLLSFPPIVFILMLLAAAGSSLIMVVIGIVVVMAPRIMRIVRAVTMEVAALEYVEAAVARGERLPSLLFREVLPNIWTPVLADVGPRFTGSIILAASLSYLGLGVQPPTPDWALMINENRTALLTQPLVLLVPAGTIALLTVGINLIADAAARSIGRSVTSRGA
jgi:peptide/nickel transport system permease protein